MRIPATAIITAFVITNSVLCRADTNSPETTDKRSLIGEITFEDSAPAQNTYAQTQDAAIDYFHKLSDLTSQLAQGATSGSVPPPSDNMLSYLNAAYLYCAVNYGECPLILDAILEGDIVNSRMSKDAQCPTMTRFWKSWVRGDMEARHKYLVKTAFLKVTSDFNQQKRPAYIKCKETVATQISAKEPDNVYFKARYGADSAHTLVAAKTAKLLEELKVKVPNVFGAVGSSFTSGEKPSSSPGQVKVRR